jgi:hypothetical protein
MEEEKITFILGSVEDNIWGCKGRRLDSLNTVK